MVLTSHLKPGRVQSFEIGIPCPFHKSKFKKRLVQSGRWKAIIQEHFEVLWVPGPGAPYLTLTAKIPGPRDVEPGEQHRLSPGRHALQVHLYGLGSESHRHSHPGLVDHSSECLLLLATAENLISPAGGTATAEREKPSVWLG